jgi:hypothetical protein
MPFLRNSNDEDQIKEKNAVFCSVMPCGSYKNGRFGRTLAPLVTRNGRPLRRISSQWASVVSLQLVPSSTILITLMKEAVRSSETSDLTTATRRKILEVTILHSHRRGNLKSYK